MIKSRRLAQSLFWGYALLLTALLLAPGPEVEQVASVINDKLAHAVAFALFCILAAPIYRNRRSYLLACAGIAVFGGATEFAQSVVPGRDVSWLDLLANITGIAVAWVLMQSRLR